MKIRKTISFVLGFCSLLTVGGVAATWKYATNGTTNSSDMNGGIGLNDFIFVPEEMPDEQVSAVQRLSDVLNKRYTTDNITDSWDYLINETIQVHWNNDPNEDPYVGSMDNTYDKQIDELFQDVLFETNVSFILKNQDLNGDGFNEIAMYSTSDTLDNTSGNYDGVVCVYVTVFTPTIDSQGNIIGYTMVCESLRGYCYEIQYAPTGEGRYIPSFSTDEWRDDVGYTYNNKDYAIPDTAKNADGTKPYKQDYNSYNQTYTYVEQSWWGDRKYTRDTTPYGQTLSQVLADDFANLK